VTSADVAREAGVARSTVSYVLNDTPHQKIPDRTRQRVLDAAARLGYAPSAAARALRSGRSDVVLGLLPDWPLGPAVGHLLQHLTSAFARRKLTFVVHSSTRSTRPLSEIWKAITPAAVLALDEFSEADATAMRLGYAYPDDQRVAVFAEPRLAGVRAVCAELGRPEPDVRTIPLTPAGAADGVRAWLAADPPVTGICAFNDEIAMAVLAGLRHLGREAPRDMAVIGVDDIPNAAVACPPLTTVVRDFGAIAEYYAGSVVAALAGDKIPVLANEVVHLQIREST
jgi:DNA-binding LacI/PurR family transcriptional regulator